jgi:alkylation response protein AidB-like acyl-CoA dehydrogenase
MDFRFSEEQTSIQELAREILQAEATTDRLKAAEASSDFVDEALWKQLAEANLLGIAIDEPYGGMGMGFLELCVLLEEIGRVAAPTPAHASLVLGGLPLGAFGSEAQKAAWLPRLASGEAVATATLLDAGSSDFHAPATTAREDGDGFVLDGVKRAVPFARRADLLLVPAKTADGVGVFLVEGSAAGLSLSGGATSVGEPLFDVVLEGVRVGAGARLPADGAEVLAFLGPHALVAVAAQQVGVSERALEITTAYVRDREQFGVPIGSFQAVQHRSADGFIDLEAMRWTMWRAAWLLAAGQPAGRDAMVAKFWAADAGSRIANSTIHLHGGIGSDVDYPIQRYFLWAKSLELTLGSASPMLRRLGQDMAATGPQEAS